MESLGFDKKNPLIFNIIAAMETDDDPNIDFDQFLNALAGQLGDRHSNEGIKRIFELFDCDKNVVRRLTR